MTQAPILAFPRFDEEFILDTDASDFGIGGVIFQVQDGQERVIVYTSRTLTKSERKYSTTRKELLAMVTFMKQFRPVNMHTDQGRNFESKSFQEMCRLLDIKKTRTTPYHHQSDGLVERFNRTLESTLSMYVSNHQNDWDKYLQMVMYAYRSSVQESTRFTPYYMMFSREARLPVDVMFGGAASRVSSEAEYVRDLRVKRLTMDLIKSVKGLNLSRTIVRGYTFLRLRKANLPS